MPRALPDSIEHTRALIAYHERIFETSKSADRIARAERILARSRPHLEQLEAEELARVRRIETATPPVSTTVQAGESLLDARRRLDREQEEFESIWDGRGGLTSYQGNSSLRSMS
jgi:hypothetical protein